MIAALAVAQKKDAEERARREAKEDFRGRFRMVFGKPATEDGQTAGGGEAPAGDSAEPPPDETIWEDDGDAPPERLPDSANVDDAAGKQPPEEPPPAPPDEPPPPPAPKPTPKPKKPAKRTGAAKRTVKKGRKK